MTISLTGATVDTGVPAQNVRAPSNPVISTAGNDNQAIARQQLPSAVPAPALLAAYSTGIAPKPTTKSLTSTPSSAFAAQFIAQDAGSQDDLAIFELPAKPQAANDDDAGNDYLNDLKIARGDFSAVSKAQTAQPSAQTQAATAAQNAKPVAMLASDAMTRSGAAQQAMTVPNILSQFIRRPTLVQAKGVGAYQLAEARNATTKNIAAATTPVAEPVEAELAS